MNKEYLDVPSLMSPLIKTTDLLYLELTMVLTLGKI